MFKIPFKHGVEGGNFIDAHSWHIQHVSNVMHGRDWQPSYQCNRWFTFLINQLEHYFTTA